MTQYIKVAPATNIPPEKNQLFTYQTEGKVKVGQEVIIPFQKRKLRGVVWDFEKRKPKFKTKEVEEVVGKSPILDENHFKLALWISYYYYCPLGLVVKLMLPPSLKRYPDFRARRKKRPSQVKRQLTEAQRGVFQNIIKSQKKFFLLHGVTGSGKTEIYLRLCEEILAQKKQVIILVPEISLTHQAIDIYSSRFSDKIALIHSRLSKSERFTEWQRIRLGQAKIVIGPRSAIFAPVRDLGLIVLDEEHDPSFKQYDQNPRYHAREVALKLAEITGAKLILGSATPSVATYYQIWQGKFKLLELPQRIGKERMPRVEIVDLREEFQKFRKNHPYFISSNLYEKLNNNFVHKRQAILFLNRRGAASFVFCQECGYVLKCPQCDVSLTYHTGSPAQLVCHYCNFKTSPPAFCLQCKSPHIKYSGLGTQRIENELKKIIPQARIARFDRDATQKKGEQRRIYYDFVNHKIDILVGTQMLTQGWDLTGVALIGIISADSDLNLPDFRSTERTFNLLTQVAGRTGRGEEVGEVVLQTYNPENFAIQAAARHNYKAFFQEEIKNRKELSFPPFSKFIKLVYRNYKKQKAEEKAKSLGKTIRQFITRNKLPVSVLGPAPPFIPRIRRRYSYQIILTFKPKGERYKAKVLSRVPPDWVVDVDPESLL